MTEAPFIRPRHTEAPRHRENLRISVPQCLGVYVFSAVIACATTILPVDFSQMVAESELIVVGRVTAIRSQETAGRRTIESFVTVDVTDALKGQPGRAVVFRVPGGQVGRYRRVMVGAPEFDEGDEVVLFLNGNGPVVPMPYGLSQGVYRIQRGASGAVVTPLVTDGATRVVRGDPARRPLTVDAFAREVRAQVAR